MCACTCKCVCLSVSLRERWRVHVCERESGELTLRSLGTFPHIGIFNSHVLKLLGWWSCSWPAIWGV